MKFLQPSKCLIGEVFAYSSSYLENCNESCIFGNSAFISLYDQMIKQDDKHGFIKYSNEKHSTIFINSPKLMQHGTG